MDGGTGTGAPAKRIILPGIKKPSKLERNIIYVSFPENESLTAIIESNRNFRYNRDYHKKYIIPGFIPDRYDLLIEELVVFNHGKVDYSRVQKEVLYPIFEAFIRDLESGKVRV